MSSSAFWRAATLVFTAGVVGAIPNRVALWVLGVVQIIPPPSVTLPWIYAALVWGGLFGLLFLIPWKAVWWQRGLVFSLGPTAAVWLYFYPVAAHAGMFGLNRGVIAPLIPLVVNGIWGVCAAWWLEFIGEGQKSHA